MSEFHVEVVRIGEITKHPDADTLGITKVSDYPIIVRLGDFWPGDLAVYIPVDSLCPDNERFYFLAPLPKKDKEGNIKEPSPSIGQVPVKYRRVKAKRLRGIFSMGLLIHADEGMAEGEDVTIKLGIEKYEPPPDEGYSFGDTRQNERDYKYMPTYTDIEGLRRWKNIFIDGEEVIMVEKIHGENARFCYEDNRLWIGSRTNIKKNGVGGWGKAAELYDLENKLAAWQASNNRKIVIYGETCGYTGGFPYGVKRGEAGLRLFDIYDREKRTYVNFDEFILITNSLELPIAPILYRGPWDKAKAYELAEGDSTLGKHVREGVVIRPIVERQHDKLGRVILKLHGEGFLTK
jgi:RNA ligase (TIGR02306 family)